MWLRLCFMAYIFSAINILHSNLTVVVVVVVIVSAEFIKV